MVSWEKYRKLFPHLSNQIYLNHAAIAPMNTRAREAVDLFSSQRLEGNIEFWPEAIDRKQLFKEQIGELINAQPQNVALVPNTSAGLNILTLGLDWQPGDRILLNDFEFPANVIPFLSLKRKGVEIDFIHHREGRIEIDDLRNAIQPKTRVLSISFVQFLNGFRSDLRKIGEICREHDIIFCVDAIQGVGALAMDVEEMQIDFLATGGHKWLMWPGGLGFVYLSPRIFHTIYPAQAGWLSLETPWDFFNYQQDFSEDAQRFEPGTFNIGAIVSASATLGLMLEIGASEVEKKILENTDYLIKNLIERDYRLLSDTASTHRSGIVSFYHPRAEEFYEYLKKQHQITVSLREGMIRVSPHFYNNMQDMDAFIKAVQDFENE